MEFNESSYVFSISGNNFPGKLWLLVNDHHISSICWNSSGEEIIIREKSFIDEVLKLKWYFKTTDFNSFIRQLNLYGFRKVRVDDASVSQLRGTSHMRYRSANFRRDKPELLINLKRLTPSNKAKLAAGLELTSRKKRFPEMLRDSPVIKNGWLFNSKQIKLIDRT